MNYTVTLSEAQDAALSYVSLSQQDWIQNAVYERCRIAIEEIVQVTVQKCLQTGTQIPSSTDEIVMLAFSQGWIKTAAQRQSEADQITEGITASLEAK